MSFDDEDEVVGPPPAALAGFTGHLLARAFIRVRALGLAAMPPGRYPRELGILSTLREEGPVSQRRLSDVLGINRTVMVKLIDLMERDGLVRRERDPHDRRSYAVTPTREGLEALPGLDRAMDEGERVMTARLTGAERERLSELLVRLLPDDVRPPALFGGRLGYLLVANHFRMRERARLALRSVDLDPRQFGMLVTLDSIEPCSQQRLAQEMGVSGPAVVGLIDAMHGSGWIERERNPEDRRAHVLRLTAEGRTDMAAARTAIDALHSDLATRLGDASLDELNTLLLKLLQPPA